MLKWKIFAVTITALEIWSDRDMFSGGKHISAVEWIWLPVTVISMVGLIIYAFSMPVGRVAIWKAVSSLYLTKILYDLKMLLQVPAPFIIIKIFAVAILCAFMVPIWLSIYRLAGSPWNAAQTRRRIRPQTP